MLHTAPLRAHPCHAFKAQLLLRLLPAVVSGSKTFTLLPPADVYRMRLRRYPLATFAPQGAPSGFGADVAAAGGAAAAGCDFEAGGGLTPMLHESQEEVLWSSVQPEDGWTAAAASSSSREDAGRSQCDPRDQEAAGGGGPRASSCGTTSSSGGGGWAGDLFADPRLPRPLRVTVRAGESIYLPAMW